MRTRRWPWLVTLALLACPASATAAPNWITPVSPLSGNVLSTTTPMVASNARGDTAVAWFDQLTQHIFVSERPVGGNFTLGSEVSTIADQFLGSVDIDEAGNIYVFFITDNGNTNLSRPRVGVKQLGAATWDVTPLAPAAPTLPPQAAIGGAVSPSGKGVAVWFHGNTSNATLGKLDYSIKQAGSSTWAPKAELPGFTANSPGPLQLAMNSAGEAALVYSRQACSGFSQGAHGATMNAAGVWTTANALNTCANNGAGLAGGPVVGIDENGTATAAWSQNNAPPAGSGNDIIQFTTKTIGAASWPTAPASGANDLSATGANAGFPAIAVAPDGATTVAWIRSGVVQERSRPAGGGSFGSVTSIPNTLTAPIGTLLATGADGSVVAAWSGTNGAMKSAIGAARRGPGETAFSALPAVPAEDNTNPALATDGEGNAPAAWIHMNAGPTWVVQGTGLDAAGPAISNVNFPATAALNTPFSYGATLSDRWSTPAGVWGFGDGTTGPVSGTKSYATAGTFTATLSALDSSGNNTTATRSITVGGPGGGGGGGGGDTDAPVFLSARLTNTTFAVNPRGPAETPVGSAAKRGTTFVYSLSEAARVVFTIHAKKPGRRVRGRCVKPTPRNRNRRKCTRFVRFGRFAQSASAGQNRKKFSGRIGRRSLRPGRYRATLVATDAAGNRSAPRRLNFRVVRR
jgi:hypothetical protein